MQKVFGISLCILLWLVPYAPIRGQEQEDSKLSKSKLAQNIGDTSYEDSFWTCVVRGDALKVIPETERLADGFKIRNMHLIFEVKRVLKKFSTESSLVSGSRKMRSPLFRGKRLSRAKEFASA